MITRQAINRCVTTPAPKKQETYVQMLFLQPMQPTKAVILLFLQERHDVVREEFHESADLSGLRQRLRGKMLIVLFAKSVRIKFASPQAAQQSIVFVGKLVCCAHTKELI